ncbi:sugar phosphate nucleotidyltransferase [Gottfriedia solisilvae]|uniref:Glucose-1-phosphate thymidylyltransferase n=1 Tax=Gottfriedia solisilvae TaxID=1516104 RepID=A0A8J3AW67_9BACI|nr:NDP-sugar synthase [Gottfriedia solisilvae]GGI17711.1 glucose-1-phosphate thymidylyltransferase [Gottfriedia solisilvae]
MVKRAIILAAGKGSKMFPFSEVRSKTTLKIAGKSLIRYNIESIMAMGIEEIVVVVSEENRRELENFLYDIENIQFVTDQTNLGSAESLVIGAELLSDTNEFIVLYGDTIIEQKDLEKLLKTKNRAVLLKKLKESARNWVGASMENGYVKSIGAHYRGDSITHQFAGFLFDELLLDEVKRTPDYFPDVKVGVGAPKERFLEAALLKSLEKDKLQAVECSGYFFDIDKPWHMLEANEFMVNHFCNALQENQLAEGATISKDATIHGHVKLGKNSRIGDRVVIHGNLIVGDNTVIDNGAIFNGNAVIGDQTIIRNYCIIYSGVSIGSHCIFDHCAEFLGGLVMDKVYLYHYGEFYGAIGSHTDIGAATVCGTLRFDDGETEHVVNGRKEVPLHFSNAAYLGDYCRTGVNTIIMPGCKIGAYSVLGAGAIIDKDIEKNSLVFVKQDLIIKKWSEKKYGW